MLVQRSVNQVTELASSSTVSQPACEHNESKTEVQRTNSDCMEDEEPANTTTNPGLALLEQVNSSQLLPRKRRRIARDDLPEDLRRQVYFLSNFASNAA